MDGLSKIISGVASIFRDPTACLKPDVKDSPQDNQNSTKENKANAKDSHKYVDGDASSTAFTAAKPPLPTTQLVQKLSSSPGFVSIKPFNTGRMVTPAATLVGDAQGLSMGTSWRFFIQHEPSGTKLWFDMGISHDLSQYIPHIQALHQHFKAVPSERSIVQDTESLGVFPGDVKHIIVSHAHWDHLGPMPAEFSAADMIVGPGSKATCAPGWPADEHSKFDGRIWDATLRSHGLIELPPTSTDSDSTYWQPLGPFPHAHDFFGDGSLYLIDAPGHMEGNIAALCRVQMRETKKSKWVMLGGDCAHCNMFTYWPLAPFGKMPKAFFPSGTLHCDAHEARETIKKIALCKEQEGNDLLVWYAHAEFLEGAWEL
ncbi:hypothetical protein SEUCBS140593_008511 [Sporothrix eucalyptigena]|uniref:Metallo-beta-lactamase domain-containing protein n=1 Tax=Sporothrix eucalyptigena TaxID=1812306 RepID=A0ABP0CM14_9PEZI